MTITRIPVQSTNVAAIGYDPATKTLEVEFTNKNVYQYRDVPEAAANEFTHTPMDGSHGKHFRNHIRPNYQGEKVIITEPADNE